MKTINHKDAIQQKIDFLKDKQAEDLIILKNQYFYTIESLKPINIIKTAAQEFIASPNLKSNLINGVIGIGTQYLSKNLLNENSSNPVKRVLGRVFKFALKNFVGRKSRLSNNLD